LKNYIYAATALLAFGMAVPQARANSAIFTLGSSPSNGDTHTGTNTTVGPFVYTDSVTGLTIAATGYSCVGAKNGLCSNDPTTPYGSDTAGLYQNADGLGMTGSGNKINQSGIPANEQEIPNSEFVQIDFSTLINKVGASNIKSITFTVTDIVDSWSLYAATPSEKGELEGDGKGTAILVNSANSGTTSYTYYGSDTLFSIVAGNQCHVVLTGIDVEYAPEPATFVLMGFALVGMGIAGKKLRRRS